MRNNFTFEIRAKISERFNSVVWSLDFNFKDQWFNLRNNMISLYICVEGVYYIVMVWTVILSRFRLQLFIRYDYIGIIKNINVEWLFECV